MKSTLMKRAYSALHKLSAFNLTAKEKRHTQIFELEGEDYKVTCQGTVSRKLRPNGRMGNVFSSSFKGYGLTDRGEVWKLGLDLCPICLCSKVGNVKAVVEAAIEEERVLEDLMEEERLSDVQMEVMEIEDHLDS